LTWTPAGSYDQPLVFDAQFHLVAEATLFNYGFRNADAAGIANTHKFNGHNANNYIVITGAVLRPSDGQFEPASSRLWPLKKRLRP
jgi:hypothetical protein